MRQPRVVRAVFRLARFASQRAPGGGTGRNHRAHLPGAPVAVRGTGRVGYLDGRRRLRAPPSSRRLRRDAGDGGGNIGGRLQRDEPMGHRGAGVVRPAIERRCWTAGLRKPIDVCSPRTAAARARRPGSVRIPRSPSSVADVVGRRARCGADSRRLRRSGTAGAGVGWRVVPQRDRSVGAVSRVARAVEDHRSGRPGRDPADPSRGASIQPARGGTRAGAGGCGAHEPHLVRRPSCASCAPDRCHRRGGRVGGSSAACRCALPRCDREAAGDRRADAGGCHGRNPIRPRLRVSSRAIGPAVSRCFLRRRGRESARPVGSKSDRPVL